jgi:triosephosphate isomerase (TIM)
MEWVAGSMRKLIVGNWKMNGLSASLRELLAIAEALPPRADLFICPPATLIAGFASAVDGSGLGLGAQDCHAEVSGAHTGDLSAQMLADIGARVIIVGHSERRTNHGETDALVLRKAQAALHAGCRPIICVGETEAERDAGSTLSVVEAQLAGSIPADAPADRIIIAYEPVWAIGTGRTPSVSDVAVVHAAIRRTLLARFGEAGRGIAILYGGSVKPSNAAELLHVANVDGALVGGASLKPADFLGIAAAA